MGCLPTLAAMRALYLSYDGLTDSLGRSQVLPYIIGLRGCGHEFTIISFEKAGRYAKDGDTIRQLLYRHGIEWHPLSYTASPPILSTVYDVLRLKHIVKVLHRENPFDLVHCRSYITSLAGLSLKRKYGLPFIFDMRAFYADERIDGGLWNLKNPIFRAVYSYFKKKEQAFIQEADHTISLTSKAKDIILGWSHLKGQPLPVTVIPCCADLTHFSAENVDNDRLDDLRASLGIGSDDFVLAYLGSIGTWYMLPEMLDFFKVLCASRPNAKFLFITRNDPSEITQAAYERQIASDRIVIVSGEREEIPTLLGLAHLSIFFIRPVFSKSGSSPTKHGELLGMGLPVVANAGVGDVDSIIRSTGTGLLIGSFTIHEYQEAVSKVDELIGLPKQQMRRAAEMHYSLEMGVAAYDEVYSKCKRQ